MKIIVIYESKYGNTEIVAENIVEGIRQKGVEIVLKELQEVDLNNVLEYDAVLIGTPNHFGRPTRNINQFIDNLGKVDLKGNQIAVFDTYMGKDYGKAVKKMEKRISEKAPDLKLVSSGLSIRVQGMKGPILEEEIPKCTEFGNRIASQLLNLAS